MLYPPCRRCGDEIIRTTPGAIALELARSGYPIPAALRNFVEARGAQEPVFACDGCGWSGFVILVA